SPALKQGVGGHRGAVGDAVDVRPAAQRGRQLLDPVDDSPDGSVGGGRHLRRQQPAVVDEEYHVGERSSDIYSDGHLGRWIRWLTHHSHFLPAMLKVLMVQGSIRDRYGSSPSRAPQPGPPWASSPPYGLLPALVPPSPGDRAAPNWTEKIAG